MSHRHVTQASIRNLLVNSVKVTVMLRGTVMLRKSKQEKTNKMYSKVNRKPEHIILVCANATKQQKLN